MIDRNITISYILAFSKNTWFWLGIWVFYYLRFTNYAGIGLIETILIITITVTEIPTGAIADLIGKKKTLIVAFLLEAIGGVIMAMTASFNHLALAVFIMCVGGSLYSGTLEALVYDTLKQNNRVDDYDKKIANINSISLIAPANCSLVGGYLYILNPTLPFWGNAAGYFIGLVASFFLIEPKIDTLRFSLRNFINQNAQGFKQLFIRKQIRKITVLLLTTGFFVVISSEMLDSFLSVEFGFKPQNLGMLWSIIFLISAYVSQLTPIINRRLHPRMVIFLIGLFTSITLMISPIVGLTIGGIALIFRSALQGLYGNFASILINQNTESRYRATTLSTFNMIKNIPYVLLAYFIGTISDSLSAKTTSLYLGIILLILILSQLPIWSNKKSSNN